MCYCEENSVPHIVFNNIECVFRKSGVFSYLIFCESGKNKIMLDYYVSITDQLKEEILSWTDECEYNYFVICKDFMRFKFRTDDELVYNKVVNITDIDLLFFKKSNRVFFIFKNLRENKDFDKVS